MKSSHIYFSFCLVAILSLNGIAQCEQHQQLLDLMDKSMAEKNVELMAEIYHDDAIRHTSQGSQEGLEKIMAESKAFYKEWPNAEGNNLEVICTDDRIVARWEGKGTHETNGKAVNVKGITIMKIKDGKIAEEWESMNDAEVMMQMGYQIIPPEQNK